MVKTNMKYKTELFVLVAILFSIVYINSVHASVPDTTVYITSSGNCYHLDGCSEIKKTKMDMKLSDTKGRFEPCSVCNPPSNEDVDTSTFVASQSATDNDEPEATDADNTSSSSSKDANDANVAQGQSSSLNSSSSSSGNKPSESTNSKETTTSKNTTNTSNVSNTSNASNNSTQKIKELLTEKQRRSKYASKTNPAMKSKVTTPERPISNGFKYADFGTYNSYNSDNKLGGTPVYLLGTVMDVVPFMEITDSSAGTCMYRVGILMNDCDGYQWYIRGYVDKNKYELLKNAMVGKAGYVYGTYAGYSGILKRPMIDIATFNCQDGSIVNMAVYL